MEGIIFPLNLQIDKLLQCWKYSVCDLFIMWIGLYFHEFKLKYLYVLCFLLQTSD